MRLRTALSVVVACAIVLAGCSGGSPRDDPGATDAPTTAEPTQTFGSAVRAPADSTTVLAGETSAQLAAQASETFFLSAPVVVLADAADPAMVDQASALAVDLGVPVLLAPPPADLLPTDPRTPPPPPPGQPTESEVSPTVESTVDPTVPFADDPDLTATASELGRLDPTSVIAIGAGAEALAGSMFEPSVVIAAPEAKTAADLGDQIPALTAPAPVGSVAVLTTGGPEAAAARANAEVAGADVVVTTADPRAASETIATFSANPPAQVVGIGAEFGSPEQLAYRVGVASTGVELPGGGQVLYPYRRNVALYGNPTTAALGSLGEQGVEASVKRVTALAAEYQKFTDETVVPTFEIIASVASSVPSSGGDYSTEMSPEELRPYVDAAADAGIYVVLDLQPGRSDFLTQAKLYEEFLIQPHVGLALDPEWRLKPNQVHLQQVGTVTAAEINSVVTWLADLTRARNLPQKLLLLHQFKTSMISDRQQVDTSRDELAVLIHVDGFGPPAAKFATWNSLRADPPPNVWWGWKNFIDEDSPTFTPQQTMAIDPVPQFVSYQ